MNEGERPNTGVRDTRVNAEEQANTGLWDIRVHEGEQVNAGVRDTRVHDGEQVNAGVSCAPTHPVMRVSPTGPLRAGGAASASLEPLDSKGDPTHAPLKKGGRPARRLRQSLMEGDGRGARAFLYLGMGLALVGMSGLAIEKYLALRSDWAFDLAFFHNLIFNAASGRGFVQSASTHEANGLLSLSHGFFLLPVLVPFYWLVPRLELLLLAQVVVLVSGAWPVRVLARGSGASPWVASLTAWTYLFSFILFRLALTDFRPLLVAIPGLLWLAAGLVSRRLPMALAGAILACLAREEVPFLVASMAGLLLIFRQARARDSSVILLLAAVWFSGVWWLRSDSMTYYVPFDRPGVLLESWHMGTPEGMSPWRPYEMLAAYLPPGLWAGILQPVYWLAAAPLVIYQLFLSPYEWWSWEGAYVHHCGPLLAFAAAGAAVGWGRLDRWMTGHRRWGCWVAPVILGGALLWQLGMGGWQVYSAMGWADGMAEAEARAFVRRGVQPLVETLRGKDRVATDFRMIARLSGRRWLYCYQTSFDWGEAGAAGVGPNSPGLDDVDWMLVDVAHGARSRQLELDPAWMLLETGGGYGLYRRIHGVGGQWSVVSG